MPSRLVQRIHFEDFGGTEFERIVFAYHVRAGWTDLAWFGQTGSDEGRDIVGRELIESGGYRSSVIQCVNRKTLTQKKAEEDMMRAFAASRGTLKAFKFVVGGTVSAARRDAVEEAAVKAGITSLAIWSGVDFEEHLRLIGEDLLRRFCDGDPFPDRPDELCHFASDFPGLTDIDALEQMAVVFQRPVFQTCFQEESSLPAFQTAIEDTIAALNTGVWRTREGETIRRIPSLHHLRNPQVKAKVRKASELVDKLRRTFIAGLRDKTIRPCGCGNPSCPTFMIDRTVAASLDDIRKMALDAFREAYSPFDVHLQ